MRNFANTGNTRFLESAFKPPQSASPTAPLLGEPQCLPFEGRCPKGRRGSARSQIAKNIVNEHVSLAIKPRLFPYWWSALEVKPPTFYLLLPTFFYRIAAKETPVPKSFFETG